MRTKTNCLLPLAALALSGAAGWAQGTAFTNSPATVNTGAVFRVSFAAQCLSFDSTRGRVVSSRLTDRDIIAQAVGGSPAATNLLHNFALAYNAAEDSLQVVDTNLLPVVDVVHFGGGAAIADNRQLARFTLMFFPGQTNESGAETNVFGSAVITERTHGLGQAGTNSRPNLTGRLQFVLTDGNILGMTNQFVSGNATNAVGGTNAVPGTNGIVLKPSNNNQGVFSNLLSTGPFVMTNASIVFDPSARICTATFTTARPVPGSTPPSAPLGGSTNGVGTTNTTSPGITTTNGVTGTTGTNGAATGGTTTTPGTVIGFNPTTGTVVMPPTTGTANLGAGSVGGTPGVAGVPGTTGVGTIGVTTTPGVTTTTGVGTTAGAASTGTGAITPGTTAGTGAVTTGTPVGSGSITTGTGMVGTGVTGTTGTTGLGTTTGTTTGIPISTGF